MKYKDECIICGAPLVYLDKAEEMECSICYEILPSKTRCRNGHFVCDRCHSPGVSNIIEICITMTGANPVDILERLMKQPFCHMHGPEHHTMVGAALLTAYHNAGGRIGGRMSGADSDENGQGMSLRAALEEMMSRGHEVPGGACGFWGACGAGVSTGMFVSIVTGSTPLEEEAWGLANQMTGKALAAIGTIGGPRCCKRDSYLALEAAVEFCEEKFGVKMEWSRPICRRSTQNNQCIGVRCPFHRNILKEE